MDEDILEKLIPIPSLEEQKEDIIKKLEAVDFPITNFHSGSVWGTIILIFCQVKIDILELLRIVFKSVFVKSSYDGYLDIKAYDYSKVRKEATKAKGKLTIVKTDADGDVTIPANYIFKTSISLAGGEYRFFNTEKVVIPKGEMIGYITVVAEKVGSEYNVPTNSLNKQVVHIEGVEAVYNDDGWLLSEGSDVETDDSFKERTLNSWAELSTNPISLEFKNVAEGVDGVLYAIIDDMHPRGQGTVDIIVVSYAGTAGEELLNKVEYAVSQVKGVYDNILVKSAETVTTDIDLILYISQTADDSGLVDKAVEYTKDYFKISNARELNTFYQSELIFHIRKNIDILKGIKVVNPATDLQYAKNEIIVLGEVNVTIERV